MNKKVLLLLDGIGNVALGLILLLLPHQVIRFLSASMASEPMFVSILGAILFAIGVALLLEALKKSPEHVGLGLTGAVLINLSFAIVLALWLIFGDLNLYPRGSLVLWILVVVLIGFGGREMLALKRCSRHSTKA
jgi:hypothetical protein